MDPLMIVLRIFHISFGVFWVGQLLFRVLTGPIMMSRLRASRRPMRPMRREQMEEGEGVSGVYRMCWWTGVSAIITVGTGVAMTLIMRWGNLGAIFTTPWGWAIFYGGFVATIAFLYVAWGITVRGLLRPSAPIASPKGSSPTPEGAQRMGGNSRLQTWSWVEFWLHVITVLAMAVARFLPA